MYCTASAYNLVGLQEHLEQLGYRWGAGAEGRG